MNKSAIQKFAVWARTALMEQVAQRAYQYGITRDGYGEENAMTVNGMALSTQEQCQRRELVREIRAKGYDQVVEEAAYTWFNRFIALRYMEVNNYLPSHIRVFSNAQGAFDPEILKEAHRIDLPGLEQGRVAEYIEKSETEALYRYLLLTQCNALSESLPRMFEHMGGYTELLFPNNILRPDSVPGRMVADIPEEDWADQVQIIGWLYQYYNTELKAETFDLLKKNVKVTRERIPSATQLFTPDWIVRYMVENSLGRLWLEGHPDPALRERWKYYLDEAEQEPEVEAHLEALRAQRQTLRSEEITLIDPCMGSGHILVYAFDVLMQIYESEGWSQRDAAAAIVRKNLYGLDIDRRAAQLAYFAVMMKARQYDRRFLTRGIQPNLYHPGAYAEGQEFGSLLMVDELEPRPEQPEEITLFDGNYEDKLNTWNFRSLLARQYDVVVTNPPYMGSSNMSGSLSDFVKKNYPDTKSDMSTAFMERCLSFCNETGMMTMINIPVWMFLASYEKLRESLIASNTFINMVHPGRGIFGSDFGTTAFVIARAHTSGYKGTYCRLFDKQGEVESIEEREKSFLSEKGRYTAQQENFSKIPGSPVAYWVSEAFIATFSHGISIDKISKFTGSQNITANNEKYLRFLWEVSACLVGQNKKWVFYIKGGNFRKWYGNIELVIDWSDNATFFYQTNGTSNLLAEQYRFREGITYTELTSGVNSFRYLPPISIFDKKGPCIVDVQDNGYCLAFFNSIVAIQYFKLLNPTITLQVKDVKNTPLIIDRNRSPEIAQLAKENIIMSKIDWDAYETAWDFKRHPLV